MSFGRLLLATNNQAKVKEYRSLLEGIPWTIVDLIDAGILYDVEETGSSFEENALLKSTIYSRLSGLTTLADDSGLEVDALGGEPGIRSARYAGEGASQKELIAHLLHKLEGIPQQKRNARFKCVIAISAPGGGDELFTGECPGIIAFKPAGKEGFGYDPVFFLPESGKTMAELNMEQKNAISHRGKAAEKARHYLATCISI